MSREVSMSGLVNSIAQYDLRIPVSRNHDLLFEISNTLERCKSQVSIALNYVKNDAGLTKNYLKDTKFMATLDSDGNLCERMRNNLHEMQNILRELQYVIQTNDQRDSGISLSGTGSERSSLERDSELMETLLIPGEHCDLPEIPKDNGQKKESLQQAAIGHDVSNGQETEKNAANEQTLETTLVDQIGKNERGDGHGMETLTTSLPNAECLSENRLNNLSNDSSDEDNTHQDSGVVKREKQKMPERPTTAECASTMLLGEDEQKLLDTNSVSRKGKSQQRKEAAEHTSD
ncbi:hypothetical protein ACJMK2_035371 [Sinanodonta woodiana]|uniref:Uncharacterized protein n=1 Tax=Sinanodonta woodiana TaxID=1069815 RepID=A0ABD3WYR2_SINWO